MYSDFYIQPPRGNPFKDRAIITELRDSNLNEPIWKNQESFAHIVDTTFCIEASLIPYDNFWKDSKNHSKA